MKNLMGRIIPPRTITGSLYSGCISPPAAARIAHLSRRVQLMAPINMPIHIPMKVSPTGPCDTLNWDSNNSVSVVITRYSHP